MIDSEAMLKPKKKMEDQICPTCQRSDSNREDQTHGLVICGSCGTQLACGLYDESKGDAHMHVDAAAGAVARVSSATEPLRGNYLSPHGGSIVKAGGRSGRASNRKSASENQLQLMRKDIEEIAQMTNDPRVDTKIIDDACKLYTCVLGPNHVGANHYGTPRAPDALVYLSVAAYFSQPDPKPERMATYFVEEWAKTSPRIASFKEDGKWIEALKRICNHPNWIAAIGSRITAHKPKRQRAVSAVSTVGSAAPRPAAKRAKLSHTTTTPQQRMVRDIIQEWENRGPIKFEPLVYRWAEAFCMELERRIQNTSASINLSAPVAMFLFVLERLARLEPALVKSAPTDEHLVRLCGRQHASAVAVRAQLEKYRVISPSLDGILQSVRPGIVS